MIKMEATEKIKEEIKKIVIARLNTLNPDSKILLLEEKEPISVREMIKEVINDSDLGKKIVEVQYLYLKMLTSGEIDR